MTDIWSKLASTSDRPLRQQALPCLPPDIWGRLAGTSDRDGIDYWSYFGLRLVEHADIIPETNVLDVGCGAGSSLFPAAERAGRATGLDICPH